MLEDADAMKAHAQLHGTYNESAAKGRPLLHAALQAERLVMQLIGWAAQMPLFAAHITGRCSHINSQASLACFSLPNNWHVPFGMICCCLAPVDNALRLPSVQW